MCFTKGKLIYYSFVLVVFGPAPCQHNTIILILTFYTKCHRCLYVHSVIVCGTASHRGQNTLENRGIPQVMSMMAEEVVFHSAYWLCVSVRWLWCGKGGGRNLSRWLLEFQEGVSHFLLANLGNVCCYCRDEQPAPTQLPAVRLMYYTILNYTLRFRN